MYVLHIRVSGKLFSAQFVKVDKASSPATSSIEKASNVDLVSVWSLFNLVLKNYEDIQ